MLELIDIKKDYPAGGDTVHALKGINLKFRESEFVSILGPSGCGKTTLLNIIGGLDGYTEGDLIINGKSTKDFHDRDWDSYRNHSIGFVFQSYNLIPHQSVLQNVELALSLSGVSKSERRKRAIQALEDVGLGNQLKKKPAEMSGGQMQRVAIARALVNNPDIILADEPTGALDTETSIQVMNILKEVAKDRLVIMVTHNPDIAKTYSTRIISMLDGLIIGDTAPVSEEEAAKIKEKPTEKKGKEKKSSMSLGTSFGLSLKNLFTKKGRTLLTAFAGSIGIIGIALILSVSEGMTAYINAVQEDTLSSYPLTLESNHMEIGTLIETFIGNAKSGKEHDKDAVYQKAMVYEMMNSLTSLETKKNDLQAFKKYIEAERGKEDSALAEAINGVQYTYNIDMSVYTENVDGNIIKADSQLLLRELMAEYIGQNVSSMIGGDKESSSSSSSSSPLSGFSGMGSSSRIFQEMLPGDNGKPINPVLENQYDLIYGTWPNDYNEIVVVVDENNEIADMTLYALGLKSKSDIDALAKAAINKTPLEIPDDKWTYEDICNMDFRVILDADCYTLDEKTGLYTDLRESAAGLKYLYDNAMVLKVTGIIRPNKDAVSAMLTGTLGYTSKLTEKAIEKSKESGAIKAQLENKSTDIFTGLPFKDTAGALSNAEKAAEFNKYISTLDTLGKAEAYVKIMSVPSEEEIAKIVEQTMGPLTRADIEAAMTAALSEQMGMAEKDIKDYLAAMKDEDITAMFAGFVAEQAKAGYAEQVAAGLAAMPTEQKAAALDMLLATFDEAGLAVCYDEVLVFSASDYEMNMRKLGYVDIENPATINLFASSFENKDIIEDAIKDYNDNVPELEKIAYTDYVGIMMSSVTIIIDAITYVLIAFVAISLVVSSIMIGVITLISVQERTKEIGILRAIGASKKNVSRMFNAETVIIGFAAGALGVLITYFLCLPINMILHSLTKINNLNAFLPFPAALILIAISVLLTLFSGIIPSRSAAKKDPVVALRTE